jgi:phenylpropionate dioxygenase-like ring-hydroxylating dioxygenase large terminal subunit
MKLLENYWYVVLESKELEVNKPKKFTRLAEEIIFWRDSKNNINAISDI